ncbi:ethanolamine kinase 1-like isoform X2 [Clupea harengus]|uniref:ethanolamine kinase n=1 Tax=Clupea harengus TaxID=7950 RepID=A0A6P8FAF2_CLUHA|nr:ethanolamine kinase 1-like isoform X2 [Clupea harengus]
MESTCTSETKRLLHLKITIKEEAPHNGVMELLKILRPQWRTEDIKMKVFTEGITNQLMGCYTGCLWSSDVVLVRVYGNMTDLYLDRRKEMEMFQILHEHGCGPKLYCSFENGICYEFLQGMVLDDTLLREPIIYRLIAEEMAKIHTIQPWTSSPPQAVLWTKMSQFLQLVRDSENKTPMLSSLCLPEAASVEALKSEMNELKRRLGHVYSPTVLCHNDLLTKNIVYNDTKGLGDIDYSLYPSLELQQDWLTTYLEHHKSRTGTATSGSERDVENLYTTVCKYSLASHFFWGLWAIIQARYSTIDFDFIKYARARFKHYFEKKEEYFGM